MGDPVVPQGCGASSRAVRVNPTWRIVTRGARAPLQRPAVRRSAWVVVDQGISSFSNFAAAVLVARSVSDRSFGAFTVAFLVYTFVLSVGRALVSQPLAIRASARTEQHDEIAAASGAALFCGAVSGLIVSSAGVAVGGPTGEALMVTGVLLPALLLQDTWRFALFTVGRPARAAVNDLAWLGAQVTLIVLVLRMVGTSVTLLTAAWASGAVVAAALGVRQTAVSPAIGQALGYLRRHLALGWRFAGENVVGNGSFQLTMLAIGTTVGVAGVGALRGAAVLFGPLQVAIFALATGGIAEGSRLLERLPHRVLPLLAAVSAVLFAVSLTWGGLLLAVPDSLGHDVLGDTWPAARELVVPYAATTGGWAVAVGALLALRIVAAASASLRLALIIACVTFAGGVSGAILWGAAGGAWGFAVGAWANALGAWWLVRCFRRDHPLVFSDATDARTDIDEVDGCPSQRQRSIAGSAGDVSEARWWSSCAR